ncbi:unnamed protein product [Protopolystoma xenopodis]|uniref:Uncharacterized protein n=1 Tax=Protopolystoma xenopodis TaxID=117903 RepID=A0A448WBU2_9PLAT|nr:unnamed protein product [Protopolystoma xenopodis]
MLAQQPQLGRYKIIALGPKDVRGEDMQNCGIMQTFPPSLFLRPDDEWTVFQQIVSPTTNAIIGYNKS